MRNGYIYDPKRCYPEMEESMIKKFSWEGTHFVSAEMESRWLTVVVMNRATRTLTLQEVIEQGKRASPRLIRIANEMGCCWPALCSHLPTV